MFIMVIIVILVTIVTHRVVVDFPGQGGGEHLGSLAKTEILQFFPDQDFVFLPFCQAGKMINIQHSYLEYLKPSRVLYNRILLSVYQNYHSHIHHYK